MYKIISIKQESKRIKLNDLEKQIPLCLETSEKIRSKPSEFNKMRLKRVVEEGFARNRIEVQFLNTNDETISFEGGYKTYQLSMDLLKKFQCIFQMIEKHLEEEIDLDISNIPHYQVLENLLSKLSKDHLETDVDDFEEGVRRDADHHKKSPERLISLYSCLEYFDYAYFKGFPAFTVVNGLTMIMGLQTLFLKMSSPDFLSEKWIDELVDKWSKTGKGISIQFERQFRLNLMELSLTRYSDSLISLDFSKICIEEKAILYRVLSTLTQLQHLDLRNHLINDTSMTQLAISLSGLTCLQQLYLGSNQIKESGFNRLVENLKNLRSLTRLDLRSNQIGFQSPLMLDNFSQVMGLQYLDLSQNYIGSEEFNVILGALSKLSGLQHLAVSNNQINIDDKITNTLGCFRNLHHFNLAENRVSAAGATALEKGLSQLTQLHYLDLKSNVIKSSGLSALASGVSHLIHLQYLNLSKNEVKDGDATLFSKGFIQLTRLNDLDLSGDRIGPDGTTSLSDALASLKRLKSLNLSLTFMGGLGAIALATVLKHLAVLEILELSSNHIGYQATTTLAESLTVLSRLKKLNLGSNNILDSGASAVAIALKHLSVLKTLDLSRNEITESGMDMLGQTISALDLTHLKELNLIDNQISDAPSLKQTLFGINVRINRFD